MTVNEMLELVDKRQEGFRFMVNSLRELSDPLIVETGCARQENNFLGDGMSTLIWDTLINEMGSGSVHSVDLSTEAVMFAASKVSKKTTLVNGDSIRFLADLESKLDRSIDLLYLDSYDFDVNDPHPSSLHHIFELLAIKKALRPGSLVAVDDNFFHWGKWMGKGLYVSQYMDSVGKPMVHRGYQWIWRW
jgi:hypothetical protein